MEFSLQDLLNEINGTNTYYKSFIDEDHLDVGVLHLKPGQIDSQQPHAKDEVYFILKGDGFLYLNNEKREIKEHHFYFVPKNTQHNFCDNSKDLIAIYFFGC
jgi:mannose-6-phosphate isomerase-like protein (cupin superfamily)